VSTSQDPEVEALPVRAQNPGINAIAMLQLPITFNYHDSKDAFERAYLEQALKLCGGQINLTSRRIGLNKVSLTDKIKKYAIDWRKIRYESMGPSLRNSATC
jgi:DNA-binding NtrC family response regulator